MKDVIIKIKGTQGLDGDTDTIELTTVGRYGIKNGSYYLAYDEGEIMGVKGVKTTVHIKDENTVVMQRTGGMRNRITVQQGVRNSCFYSTQQGEFVIGIFGESIKNELLEDGGSLTMSYTIDSNMSLISRNTVEISVREVKE